MSDRAEVRVGLFVLAALAILIVGTLWIAGFSPWRGRQPSYEVLMKGSGGVRSGDRVRVSGIEVGRVRRVELRAGEPFAVRFHVSVDASVGLRRGSTARITSDGLLGAPYLEIEPGPSDAEPLAPGSSIYASEAASLTEAFSELGAAGERLPELLDQATALLDKLNRRIDPVLASLEALLSEENVEALSGTVRTLQPTIEELRPQISDLVARLDALAATLEESVAGVPELSAGVEALVSDLRQALGPEGARLTGVLDSARETLGSADGALGTVADNSRELDALIRDLRETAANLRSLSQTLKERPSLLLRYPRPPQRRPGEGIEP